MISQASVITARPTKLITLITATALAYYSIIVWPCQVTNQVFGPPHIHNNQYNFQLASLTLLIQQFAHFSRWQHLDVMVHRALLGKQNWKLHTNTSFSLASHSLKAMIGLRTIPVLGQLACKMVSRMIACPFTFLHYWARCFVLQCIKSRTIYLRVKRRNTDKLGKSVGGGRSVGQTRAIGNEMTMSDDALGDCCLLACPLVWQWPLAGCMGGSTWPFSGGDTDAVQCCGWHNILYCRNEVPEFAAVKVNVVACSTGSVTLWWAELHWPVKVQLAIIVYESLSPCRSILSTVVDLKI